MCYSEIYLTISMLDFIAINHDVKGGECAAAICPEWWRGCVCPAMLAQHLLVGVLLWIALEEMFPFLPKITSVSVLKYGTNTFPWFPYFFSKTKDSMICECWCFLFSLATMKQSYLSPFPSLYKQKQRGTKQFHLSASLHLL